MKDDVHIFIFIVVVILIMIILFSMGFYEDKIKHGVSIMIQKLWGILLVVFGFIGSIFYLRHTAKKQQKLETDEKTLNTILEERKNEAKHSTDDTNTLKQRMRKFGYVRKD